MLGAAGHRVVEAQLGQHFPQIVDLHPGGESFPAVRAQGALVEFAGLLVKLHAQLRGALTALRVGHGDCEEMTSLFIALCRGNGIPARSVWIPGHCYPEFYLQDPEGRGCWFPCQAAGAEAFGTMTEQRPILQRGDSFRVAGESGPKRYVAETLRAKNCVADPRVQWLSRRLDD